VIFDRKYYLDGCGSLHVIIGSGVACPHLAGNPLLAGFYYSSSCRSLQPISPLGWRRMATAYKTSSACRAFTGIDPQSRTCELSRAMDGAPLTTGGRRVCVAQSTHTRRRPLSPQWNKAPNSGGRGGRGGTAAGHAPFARTKRAHGWAHASRCTNMSTAVSTDDQHSTTVAGGMYLPRDAGRCASRPSTRYSNVVDMYV